MNEKKRERLSPGFLSLSLPQEAQSQFQIMRRELSAEEAIAHDSSIKLLGKCSTLPSSSRWFYLMKGERKDVEMRQNGNHVNMIKILITVRKVLLGNITWQMHFATEKHWRLVLPQVSRVKRFWVSGLLVHTNPFMKTSDFLWPKTDKKLCIHTSVFTSFSTVHTRGWKLNDD